jgi:hypothetical protein
MLRVSKRPTRNPKLVKKGIKVKFYATYREVGSTCLNCPLEDNGCYAQSGPTWIHQNGSYSHNDGMVFLRELDRIPHGAVIRIHVSGDFALNGVLDESYLRAVILGAQSRPDVTMYGYTHMWRLINRTVFTFPDNFVLNASCDTHDDERQARALGWDITKVVKSTTTWKRNGKTVVCPAQTSDLSCTECMLCAKAGRKFDVAFKAHGNGVRKIDKRL